MIVITSSGNAHVQRLRRLHEARGRQEQGAFLVEGPHLLDATLDAGVTPALVLYAPETLERTPAGRRLAGRLEALRDEGVEVLAATPGALARAGDTQTPQGVVAAVPAEAVAAERVRARRRGRARPIVLVLDALGDPGNVGGVLRSALASDVDEVWLGRGCADPLGPKVVRAASGAHFHLPIRPALGWDEIAERLRGAPQVRQVILAEASATRPYDQFDLTQRTALIVGNEAHGPSPEAARLATAHATIPMWNKVESLNVAIAASVILFEAGRQRRAQQSQGPTRDETQATTERVDGEDEQGGTAGD